VPHITITGSFIGVQADIFLLAFGAAILALGVEKKKGIYTGILQVFFTAFIVAGFSPFLIRFLAVYIYQFLEVSILEATEFARLIIPISFGGFFHLLYPALVSFFKQVLPSLTGKFLKLPDSKE
jgi:hypothetical protein